MDSQFSSGILKAFQPAASRLPFTYCSNRLLPLHSSQSIDRVIAVIIEQRSSPLALSLKTRKQFSRFFSFRTHNSASASNFSGIGSAFAGSLDSFHGVYE